MGSLPGASSGLQTFLQGPLGTDTALPCCQESLELGIKCLSLALLPPEGTRTEAGTREDRAILHCLQPLMPRVSSFLEVMEKTLGCCWAALLTPVVYLSRCYLGTQLI